MPNFSGIWNATEQFQARAQNIWPSPPIGPGQQAYTAAGTYSWVAPAGVTAVSVVAIGAGGTGWFLCGNILSGSGGGLGYKNNISVTPGSSYPVVVGARAGFPNGGAGGQSFFNSAGTVAGNGGAQGSGGGTFVGDGGGNGGNGRGVASNTGSSNAGVGGGGAGGYSGGGGTGGRANCGGSDAGSSGCGGGAGGGSVPTAGGMTQCFGPGAGGGVGIFGQGSSGAGGSFTQGQRGGRGGSGGGNGSCQCACLGDAGLYGGGGSFWRYSPTSTNANRGAGGAVRIIWAGTGSGCVARSFPSTNTGDL